MSSALAISHGSSRRYRGWVLPISVVALWWLASHMGWSQSGLLVSPEKVAATAWDQIASGKFWRAISASLTRNLSGFFIGTTLGLVLSCLLGLSHTFERLVGPSFNTFKQISLFAWIPLISVWFGLGDVAKVVFLSLAALVPVVVNTCDGLRNVPPNLAGSGACVPLQPLANHRRGHAALPPCRRSLPACIWRWCTRGWRPSAPNICWCRGRASATR